MAAFLRTRTPRRRPGRGARGGGAAAPRAGPARAARRRAPPVRPPRDHRSRGGSAEATRARFPAVERMRWLAERPDVRQRITSQLTGLAPKAARKKEPDFQAALVDSVVDEADVTARDFEDAFDPVELATYGDAAAFWRTFLERFPWDDDARESQELATWLLEALLSNTSGLDGAFARKALLSALDVRTAIDGAVWHTRVPLEVRVAIDRARLAQERRADRGRSAPRPSSPSRRAERPLREPAAPRARWRVGRGRGRARLRRWRRGRARRVDGGGRARCCCARCADRARPAPRRRAPKSSTGPQAAPSPDVASLGPSDPQASAPPARDAAPRRVVPRGGSTPSLPPIPGSVAPAPVRWPRRRCRRRWSARRGRRASSAASRKTSPSADFLPASDQRDHPRRRRRAEERGQPPSSPKGPPPLLPGGNNGLASARAGSSAFPPPPAIVHGKGSAPKSAASEAFDRALAARRAGRRQSRQRTHWDTNEEAHEQGHARG